jgi:hypothetical protein
VSSISPEKHPKAAAYHPLRPFINDFDQSKLQVGAEILDRNLVQILNPTHPVTDGKDSCSALF